ncbi:MAG: hypothetical protein R3F30_15415 [Planctomycetota bacterium]
MKSDHAVVILAALAIPIAPEGGGASKARSSLNEIPCRNGKIYYGYDSKANGFTIQLIGEKGSHAVLSLLDGGIILQLSHRSAESNVILSDRTARCRVKAAGGGVDFICDGLDGRLHVATKSSELYIAGKQPGMVTLAGNVSGGAAIGIGGGGAGSISLYGKQPAPVFSIGESGGAAELFFTRKAGAGYFALRMGEESQGGGYEVKWFENSPENRLLKMEAAAGSGDLVLRDKGGVKRYGHPKD